MSAGKEIDSVDFQPTEVGPTAHNSPGKEYTFLHLTNSSEESTATIKQEPKINSDETNNTEPLPLSPTALERTAAKLADTRLSSIMINNEHTHQAQSSNPANHMKSMREDYSYDADDESPYNSFAKGRYRIRTIRKKLKKRALTRPKAPLWTKNAANRDSSPESLH